MDSTIKDLGIGLEVRLQYEELLVSLPLWFEDCNSLLNNSTMDAQNIEQIKVVNSLILYNLSFGSSLNNLYCNFNQYRCIFL